jgi:hypothetical protein
MVVSLEEKTFYDEHEGVGQEKDEEGDSHSTRTRR